MRSETMNIQELEKLNELKEKGILTEEEFNLKKKEILSGNSNVSKTVNTSNRNIFNSYLDGLKKYFQFNGRSSRYDFWSFILVNALISFLLGVFDGMLGTSGMLSVLYSLAVLIPMLAVQVRRLHDINKSGWWLALPFGAIFFASMISGILTYSLDEPSSLPALTGLIALAAAGLMIYWLAKKGDEKANDYGQPEA